jgi:hypothetical protein
MPTIPIPPRAASMLPSPFAYPGSILGGDPTRPSRRTLSARSAAGVHGGRVSGGRASDAIYRGMPTRGLSTMLRARQAAP